MADYNFSTNSFDFLWDNSTIEAFDYQDYHQSLDFYYVHALDNYLKLMNAKELRSLNVPIERAKTFIASRKDEHGRVDRDVYLLVTFKLTHDMEFEKSEYGGVKAVLTGIVDSVDV